MTYTSDNQVDMHDRPLQAIDKAASTLARRRVFMRLAWAITLTIITLGVVAVVDMALRLDPGIRLATLVVVAIGFSMGVVPLALHRPTRHDSRMTVARHLEQHRPQLRGWMSAAVDLRQHAKPSASTRSCLAEAQRRLDHTGPPRIAPRGSLTAAGACVVVGLCIAALFSMRPVTTTLAMRRVLVPLGDATWPTRTTVTSGMLDVHVHGRGLPLSLLAHNTTPGGEQEAVDAIVRTSSNEGVQTREIRLLHQDGDLHGLVIDLPDSTTQATIFFQTEDARTHAHTIEVRPLPKVAAARLRVTPPWTHKDVIEARVHEATALLPSPGNSVLAGSNIELQVHFDQPVITPVHTKEWARDHLGWTGPPPTQIKGGPLMWQVDWTAGSDHRLALQLEDPDGLRALERPRLHVRVSEDRPPDVNLETPSTDAALPPSAILLLSAEAQDDYPLHWIGLRVDTRSGQATSWKTQSSLNTAIGSVQGTVSLESIGAVPGDVIECRAEAADLGDATTGTRVTQSRARTIHVVTVEKFVDDQHATMAALGTRVRELEHLQEDLLNSSRKGQWSRRVQARQDRLSRDLRHAAKTSKDVLSALDTGRVMSAMDLEHVAQEAMLTLQESAAMAVVPADDQVDRQARQQQVRDHLEALADRLTGQGDLQLARRTIRDLLESQRALQSALAAVGDQSATARTQALNALSTDQEALADRVRSATDTLQRAAQGSPSSEAKEVLQKATAALQDSSAEQDMRRAAREAQADRQGLARSAQADAARELASIAASINRSMEQQQNDVAVLRRRLNDLHTLISRLKDRQGGAVETLSQTTAGQSSTLVLQRLRTGMLGAAERALRASMTDRSVELTLREAAEAQSTAIGALYETPPDAETALGGARQAHERLAYALELLGKAQEALAEQRQSEALQALATQMRTLADAQTALALASRTELGTDKLTRRTRFKARQFSASQSLLGDKIALVPQEAEVLLQSTVIRATIESAATRALAAADRLLEGNIDESLFVDQSKVSTTLQMVADVLEQSGDQGPDSTFSRDTASSGGGGGERSGQGDAPPALPSVAELKVLRTMQALLLQDTRTAIEQGDTTALQDLSLEQAMLANVGQALLRSVAGGGVDVRRNGALKARTTQNQTRTDPTPTPLPSLDVLLGLEQPSDATTESMPSVGSDALLALGDRMQQAASALANGSNRMASRLQADVLERIDALLKRSQQQGQQGGGSGASSPQSASTLSSPTAPSEGAAASTTSDGSSDGTQEMAAAAPKLGGVLDHHGEAWGMLPPRLRQLLEQGRRDGGSTLYAELTAQYFRNLLQLDDSP